MDPINAGKPIQPGKRRPFTLTPDEDIDINNDPAAGPLSPDFDVEAGTADTFARVDRENTNPKVVKGWLYGRGAIAQKRAELVIDGHVGAGEQPLRVPFEFEVAHKDATAVAATFGEDEAIPADDTTGNV